MRTSFKLLLPACGWMLTIANPLLAQNEGARTATVPNSMAIHTWFIVLAFGALLTWCISYSLQVQKEAQARRKGREDIVRYKEEILDEIAELETRKEAGQIPDSKYNKELKELKTRLSRVIEQLGKR